MITVNGNALEWREGMTVSDVLEAMDYTALTLITVFIGDDHVPPEDWDTRRVPEGANVRALHLHHGG